MSDLDRAIGKQIGERGEVGPWEAQAAELARLREEVERLKRISDTQSKAIREAGNELDTLRAERDEAREMLEKHGLEPP